MIAEYQQKSSRWLWFWAGGAFLFIAILFLMDYLSESASRNTFLFVGVPVLLLAWICLIVGVYYNLLGKGHSGYYILLLIFTLPGLIALCCLPDRHRAGDGRRRSGYSSARESHGATR